MNRLEGRAAIVTGGGGGIGGASARTLAGEGAAVAIFDLDADAAALVHDDIVAAGGTALALTVDLSNEAEIVALGGPGGRGVRSY